MLDGTFMAHYGFKVEGTGGGCEAYIRTGDTGETWVVTDVEGLSLPEEGGVCLLGFYRNWDDTDAREDAPLWTLRNVGEVISAIREVRHNV